ncbi:MAG: hypothetical protein QM783_09115 [Phycisphaerales bacterium]
MLVRAAKKASGDGAKVVKAIGAAANDVAIPRWTVVVGDDADLASIDDALFHWLAHSAPDRDAYLSVCGRRIAFDATPKMPGEDERHGLPVRAWPPIIAMEPGATERAQRTLG